MRRFGETGKCDHCGAEGPVWKPYIKVLDFGQGTVLEPQAVGKTLCDACEYGVE